MRADLTIYPALSSKPRNQRSVRRLRFFPFFLYPHALCLHTLSDPNPRVSSGGRLPMCMMESALAELHCNIHRERQISSNSISGFRRGGSSKASLGYPAPSKWSNQIKGGKKRGETTTHTRRGDQNPEHNRSAFLLLPPDKTSMRPGRNYDSFFFHPFRAPAPEINPEKKTSRPQEGGLKKTPNNRRGTRGKTDR